jgi:hypothetical protein
MPETLSLAPALAVALPLRMTGLGDTVGFSVGPVLSILIPLAVAGALALPALSVQVPEADCPAPSLLRTTGALQV